MKSPPIATACETPVDVPAVPVAIDPPRITTRVASDLGNRVAPIIALVVAVLGVIVYLVVA